MWPSIPRRRVSTSSRSGPADWPPSLRQIRLASAVLAILSCARLESLLAEPAGTPLHPPAPPLLAMRTAAGGTSRNVSDAPDPDVAAMEPRRAPALAVDAGGVMFIDAGRALRHVLGPDIHDVSPECISAILVDLAESLPPGGAIHLPDDAACGILDFRRVADNVQVTGGHGGTIILGGGQEGIQLLCVGLDLAIERGIPRNASKLRDSARRIEPRHRLAAKEFQNVAILEAAKPASDLFALFCSGGMQINSDVAHCAWIAGDNAFGRKTVTASARIDDSLFLWFGINWPFADYNAHWDPANRGKDWLPNAQMWLDCKGGGQGTRLYLMVETNYGNPGPGVVLENCQGMSLYHGATERASSQGPGVYWLRNCQKVQVGLRRIFPGTRGRENPGCPSHDITIEGGRGNILHIMASFGNAYEESGVNSDPELQLWGTSFDFETRGFDSEKVLQFAYTPFCNTPEGATLEKLKAQAPRLAQEWVEKRSRRFKLPNTPEVVQDLEAKILRGRDEWHPINARHEVTFRWGKDDLTQGLTQLPDGRKLPPPPSMPATDAPRLRRPVAFTQAPDFGKALLDAGADPTGTKPSDDAFAQVLFGMNRDDLEALLQKVKAGYEPVKQARARGDREAEKAAWTALDEAYDKIHPKDPKSPKERRVPGPRLDIPPGTFLLTRPIVLLRNGSAWGAGPDKTVLKAKTNDFAVLEQHTTGTVAHLTIDGGRTGLSITGADHHENAPGTLKSYIAGQNYYALTFRNQAFAGVHIGSDDPEIQGGAEFDQNKFVNLKFIRTGDYGIYFNTGMLDKWLCLHTEFEGQKKAGISIKFNNLIHGGVIGCTFRDISGPGIDLMGGNPIYLFRPYIVMVDQCEFIECGTDTLPAVDQGYGELMSFTRCKVVTKNRKVKHGYIGSAQHYEDVAVDVNLVDGSPAMVLRGVRHGTTARANGHILRNVTANGPLGFVNDTNAQNEFLRRTVVEKLKGDPNMNWDINPAAHELAPPNGWVHPFLFYQCRFGNQEYRYALVSVDPTAGRILKTVDLSPVAE